MGLCVGSEGPLLGTWAAAPGEWPFCKPGHEFLVLAELSLGCCGTLASIPAFRRAPGVGGNVTLVLLCWPQ